MHLRSVAGRYIRYAQRKACLPFTAAKKILAKCFFRKRAYSEIACLFPIDCPQELPWLFYSERHLRVVDRWVHRRMLQEGRSLSLVDEEIRLPDDVSVGKDYVHALTVVDGGDRWVYFYLDPVSFVWRNFVWRFTVTRGSNFRELQFGFRYRDFYNRYRFRHENDAFHFDIVRNGKFYNEIEKRLFVMEIGREYDFCIRVTGRRFSLFVDGVELVVAVDPEGLFPEGSVAVILWEDDGITPIDTRVSHIQVTELTCDGRA